MNRWRLHTVFLRPPTAQAEHEAALAAWAQWCEQHRGRHCEVALSSHWLMPCAGEPSQALPQWEHYMELNAAAIEQSWLLRSAAGPELSCLAPRALVEGLQQVAREHSVKLRWVGPWWAWQAQVWWAAMKQNGEPAGPVAEQGMVATEPGIVTHFTVMAGADGQGILGQVWTQAQDALSPAGPPEAQAVGLSRIDVGVSADTLLADWTRPEVSTWRSSWVTSWAEALDFVGPRVKVALWSWALLVAGLAACMAVAERAQALVASQDEVAATLRRLDRAKHQQALARQAPRAAASAASQAAAANTLDDAGLRQAARVSQLLAYPWPVVIERVELAAQQERAVLTGFSLDINGLAGKPDAKAPVRLQAALPDDASALRWVAALGDGAQLLGRDALATAFDTNQGHYALRAEATWAMEVRP